MTICGSLGRPGRHPRVRPAGCYPVRRFARRARGHCGRESRPARTRGGEAPATPAPGDPGEPRPARPAGDRVFRVRNEAPQEPGDEVAALPRIEASTTITRRLPTPAARSLGTTDRGDPDARGPPPAGIPACSWESKGARMTDEIARRRRNGPRRGPRRARTEGPRPATDRRHGRPRPATTHGAVAGDGVEAAGAARRPRGPRPTADTGTGPTAGDGQPEVDLDRAAR